MRELVEHTGALARQLRLAGHEVQLVAAPRTGRVDQWIRTGRRLRDVDALVLVYDGVRAVPGQLAAMRAAGVHPRTVLVVDRLGLGLGDSHVAEVGAAAEKSAVRGLFSRVSGVLVHRPGETALAADLGAPLVYAVPRPEAAGSPLVPVRTGGVALAAGVGRASAARYWPGTAAASGGTEADALAAPWADYVGAIEALAAGVAATEPLADPGFDRGGALGSGSVPGALHVGGAAGGLAGVRRRVRQAAVPAAFEGARIRVRQAVDQRHRVPLTRADLPEWVLPTDVLGDNGGLDQAEEAQAEARRLRLPRCRGPVEAWAALGVLAAVVRVTDDGKRMAVVVDESGPGSPLTRWLRAVGYAPVDLGLTLEGTPADVDVDVDAGTLDLVARVHPGGCDRDDVEETLAAGAWALRRGGLLVFTLPLGLAGASGAVVPADVRALVATAHDAGFVLVGDLDGVVGRRMRAASLDAELDAQLDEFGEGHGSVAAESRRSETAAYGLVRLTFRRT